MIKTDVGLLREKMYAYYLVCGNIHKIVHAVHFVLICEVMEEIVFEKFASGRM